MTKLRVPVKRTRPSKPKARKRASIPIPIPILKPTPRYGPKRCSEPRFCCCTPLPSSTVSGVPRGDGSAVVVIPGFLGTDLYLNKLCRMAQPHRVPSLFFRHWHKCRLSQPVDQAPFERHDRKSTGRDGEKDYVIGHSLGGVIARSVAGGRPKDVAYRGYAGFTEFAARWRIEPSSTPPKRFACAFCKSTAMEYCRTATPGAAPAISWIHCGATFRIRCCRPRFIPATTVLSIGTIA